MRGIFGDFTWRVPKNGYKWVIGEYERHLPRLSRGGINYVTFDGPIENESRFTEGVEPYLAPQLGEDERPPPPGHLPYTADEDFLPRIIAGDNFLEYRPLVDHPALFLEFAEIVPSLDGIRRFADQWGGLGSEGTLQFFELGRDGQRTNNSQKGRRLRRPDYLWGEVIGTWLSEISNMRFAVKFWKLARDGEGELGDLIWEEDCRILWRSSGGGDCSSEVDHTENYQWYTSENVGDLFDLIDGKPPSEKCLFPLTHVASHFVSAPDHHPERVPIIKERGLSAAATFVVEDLINEGLERRVSAQMGWDSMSDQSRTYLLPGNLIGALWLQFAAAIEGNVDHRKCDECLAWFEISPGVGRHDKIYCSDACRMRAYRKRKAGRRKVA